jgi:cell division protein FtsB
MSRAEAVAMAIAASAKRKLRAAVPPLIFIGLTAYFAWNATSGDRGLKAYAARQEMLRMAQADLARDEAERDAWDRRLAGLRNAHLDRDTLDERARAMLNLTDPADIVVPYPAKDRLFN